MRYDRANKRHESLQSENEQLRRENERLRHEAEFIRETLNSTLHEVRRFSAQISSFTSILSQKTEGDPVLNGTAQSAFLAAGMISSRLAYTDIQLNPRALEHQTPVRAGIYKKFDKTRKLLTEEARRKRVRVEFTGESRNEIEALPVFELLPFVLLDNAIKYSPNDQIVTVNFEQTDRKDHVTVKSTGPWASKEELARLFEKGFRGQQVKNLPGQGLGLFLAKEVCALHSVRIRAECSSISSYQINGINYAEFKIDLQF